MTAKVPGHVRVLGRKIKMVPSPGLMYDEKAYGEYDFHTHTIRYETGVHPVELQDTILHELTHAVDEIQGLGLTEEQVRGLATGLLAVLRDNPKLLRFLSHEQS